LSGLEWRMRHGIAGSCPGLRSGGSDPPLDGRPGPAGEL
jgi:hypothetical protein